MRAKAIGIHNRLGWAAILVAITIAACGRTAIRSSWMAPDAGRLGFEKTLVVVIHPSESVRRIAENRLVERIGSDRAVASWVLIPQADVQNIDSARQRLTGQGFDGAVAMRLIGTDQQLTYVPSMTYPTYYRDFWGYYGYGWPRVYAPGYMQTDTIATIETNVYSLEPEALVWSGVTETLNPSDIADTIDDIADVVGDELRRRGLIG